MAVAFLSSQRSKDPNKQVTYNCLLCATWGIYGVHLTGRIFYPSNSMSRITTVSGYQPVEFHMVTAYYLHNTDLEVHLKLPAPYCHIK